MTYQPAPLATEVFSERLQNLVRVSAEVERNRILMILRSMLPEAEYDVIASRVNPTAVGESEVGQSYASGWQPSGSPTPAVSAQHAERRATG